MKSALTIMKSLRILRVTARIERAPQLERIYRRAFTDQGDQ
jgi:hypothetical protein